jgi:hypothetical protein
MTLDSPPAIRDLRNGLVLRRSTPADGEKLAEFDAMIHSETAEPDVKVAAWVRDLASGKHPTFSPDDFTIVEEAGTGRIVSSMNLISQTWKFAGIPFKVGRPELVGTLPDYRRKGLVRAQFELVHEMSLERGELVQAITGIPNYYRQFGYEMTMNLGNGRSGFAMHVPKLEKDKSEEFTFRPAVESDLPFISELYEAGTRRSLVSTVLEPAQWKYELSGKSELNVDRRAFQIIQTASGEPVGYLMHPPHLWPPSLACTAIELKPGASWFHVTPAVIRYLWQTGEEYARKEGKEHTAFGFWLCANHPVYEVANERLPRLRPPYAWYLRVPDLPGFMRLIAPALEQRLAASACAAFSGEITLGFYGRGLSLNFESGRLALVAPWQPAPRSEGKAAFPGLTFLQLLFGHRTLDELQYAFPDCTCQDDLKPVLRCLFPKLPSDVWPVS